MKKYSQQEKLFNFGISFLALGAFPLVWFLSQAILFRELTDLISRNLLVVIGLLVGSSFVFLLFSGMEKLIKFAPLEKRDSLEAKMFAGPSLFMIGLFLFYPAIRTIYLSFKDRYGTSFIGLENYKWAFDDTEMLVTLRNQVIWLVFVVFLLYFLF
jgi:alpha-glucoside transport system permease protein